MRGFKMDVQLHGVVCVLESLEDGRRKWGDEQCPFPFAPKGYLDFMTKFWAYVSVSDIEYVYSHLQAF